MTKAQKKRRKKLRDAQDREKAQKWPYLTDKHKINGRD